MGVAALLTKLAVTDLFLFIVTTHLPVPLQTPDQLLNSYPFLGLAVTVAEEPFLYTPLPNTVPPAMG